MPTDMRDEEHIKHIVCGVLQQRGDVLIARRPDAGFMGGYWEFPGGKLEADETVQDALARELYEELGVRVEQASPLIRIKYDYPEYRVLLHAWRIERFLGTPVPRIGQLLKWVAPADFADYGFLPANGPILTAARLPDRYAIVEDASNDAKVLFKQVRDLIRQGIRLLRLRASGLSRSEYLTLAGQCVHYCEENGAELLLNAVPGVDDMIPRAAGIHLNAEQLMAARERPAGVAGIRQWVAASCHNRAELSHAERIGLDFAVLAPVLPTATHAGAPALGWELFSDLVELSSLPIFALGGMMPENLYFAKQQGAQGIAAIRGFLQY